MAFAAALAMHALAMLPEVARLWAFDNLRNALVLNVVLAVFNMIPLPPLDGGRVLAGLLPPAFARPFTRLERYGLAIVVALVALPPLVGGTLGLDLDLLRWLLLPPVQYTIGAVLMLAGQGV